MDHECEACGRNYNVRDGSEPTPLCDQCAHNEVDRLRAEVERLKEHAVILANTERYVERERWFAAVAWALGTNGYFREQGTMQGRYWWRGELAERAGLRWDGKQWIDAGPNAI